MLMAVRSRVKAKKAWGLLLLLLCLLLINFDSVTDESTGGKKMSKRILVIDDDEAIRKSFLLALEDTGYAVDTAESGEKGIEQHGAMKYDLIFLDLKMPGLNGVQTLRKIREMDKDTPVYIITAFYGEFFQELRIAEEEGMKFEVMKKPIGGEQLVLVAQSILEGPKEY
jgi:DNA-binding response OmpR family regulator